MEKKDDKNKKEDTTKYGEFVSSFFTWVNMEKQKEITNKLENITDNKKQDK